MPNVHDRFLTILWWEIVMCVMFETVYPHIPSLVIINYLLHIDFCVFFIALHLVARLRFAQAKSPSHWSYRTTARFIRLLLSTSIDVF